MPIHAKGELHVFMRPVISQTRMRKRFTTRCWQLSQGQRNGSAYNEDCSCVFTPFAFAAGPIYERGVRLYLFDIYDIDFHT